MKCIRVMRKQNRIIIKKSQQKDTLELPSADLISDKLDSVMCWQQVEYVICRDSNTGCYSNTASLPYLVTFESQ